MLPWAPRKWGPPDRGYADFERAMVEAPAELQNATGRIVHYTLSPNNGGVPMAKKVLAHPCSRGS
jgi:hypothetical protein